MDRLGVQLYNNKMVLLVQHTDKNKYTAALISNIYIPLRLKQKFQYMIWWKFVIKIIFIHLKQNF